MKKVRKLKLLDLNSVDKYKKEFAKLAGRKLQLHGYDLVIFPEDFEHCCYEYLTGGVYKGKFSLRRARRIPLIEQICKGEIECQIIYEYQRSKKTLVFLSEIAEFCVIVLPTSNERRKYLRFVTMMAFGRGVESGLRKILKGGKKISAQQIQSLFPKEKES